MVFDSCYRQQCKLAVYNTVVQSDVRDRFLNTLKDRLREDFQQLKDNFTQDRRAYHVAKLREVHSYLAEIKTHKTCLVCLLRPPEKVLSCGHALCDICVQYLGTRPMEERWIYSLEACVLCGQHNERTPFSLLPPTAGVRILSLDGGGIRGIIPLVLLQELEQRLCGFGLPVRSFFDFVCGTSAGMRTSARFASAN